MPETRYIKTYKDGVLISTESYEISDEQLAEEMAQARNDELHDRFKEDSYAVVSKPPMDCKRVRNLFGNGAGKLEVEYEI